MPVNSVMKSTFHFISLKRDNKYGIFVTIKTKTSFPKTIFSISKTILFYIKELICFQRVYIVLQIRVNCCMYWKPS